ncbi:MAG: class I SAM-dependent methyltransferase [Pyrinomonadaceae bacterium]
MIYGAVNLAVAARVPDGARRILDLGCGNGALGAHLKRRPGREVVGVTFSEEEAREARERLDEVLVCDLEEFDADGVGVFDCVVCSHVLEHLTRPEELLRRLRASLTEGGVLVVALPNALHWRQRFEFLRGRFEYTDGGLMDRTHYRFYDWRTARALLAECGYAEATREADGGFPLSRFVPVFGRALDRAVLRIGPGLFGVQFIMVSRSAKTT